MGNYLSNQLSYRHTQPVMVRAAMEAGGCGGEFRLARTKCAGRKKTPAEVQACIEWTASLRKCMECSESHFRNYIKIMDEGLDQDEGKRLRYCRHAESDEERWRWRWWTGMIRIPQPKKNPFEL